MQPVPPSVRSALRPHTQHKDGHGLRRQHGKERLVGPGLASVVDRPHPAAQPFASAEAVTAWFRPSTQPAPGRRAGPWHAGAHVGGPAPPVGPPCRSPSRVRSPSRLGPGQSAQKKRSNSPASVAGAPEAEAAARARVLGAVKAVGSAAHDSLLHVRVRDLASGITGGELDLSGAPLPYEHLAVLGSVLREVPRPLHIELGAGRELDLTAGALLLKAVAACPSVLSVRCDGVRAEDPTLASRLATLTAGHRREHSQRAIRSRSRRGHAARRDHQLRLRWLEEEARRDRLRLLGLEHLEEQTRLRLRERVGRVLCELLCVAQPLQLLYQEGVNVARAWEQLRLRQERPRLALLDEAVRVRAALLDAEEVGRTDVLDRRAAALRALVEQARSEAKERRQQRHAISMEYRTARSVLQREEVTGWRMVSEQAGEERKTALMRQQIRTDKEAAIAEQEAARRRAEQAEIERTNRLLAEEERLRRRERDRFALDERKHRQTMAYQERREHEQAERLRAAALLEAKAAERIGLRQRERDRVNKLPPKIVLAGFEHRRKAFWDGGGHSAVRGQQLWPRASLTFAVPLPSYLKRDDPEILPGEENGAEWTARKGHVLGGRLTVSIQSGASAPGDSIGLADPFRVPGLAVNRGDANPAVLLEGKPVLRLTTFTEAPSGGKTTPACPALEPVISPPPGATASTAMDLADEPGTDMDSPQKTPSSTPLSDTAALPPLTVKPAAKPAKRRSSPTPTFVAPEPQQMPQTQSQRRRSTRRSKSLANVINPAQDPGSPEHTRLGPLGVCYSSLVFEVVPGATEQELSQIVRSVVLRPAQRPTLPRDAKAPTVRVSVTVTLTFPASGDTGPDADVCRKRLSKSVDVSVLAPYLTLQRPLRLEWTEGDGDMQLFPGLFVRTDAPSDFKGTREMSFEDCLLRLRFLTECGSRDTIMLQRRHGTGKLPRHAVKGVLTKRARPSITTTVMNARAQQAADEEEFRVNHAARTVTCQGGHVLATIEERGTLSNTEMNTPAEWVSTQSNSSITLRLSDAIGSARLQRLLGHFIFRNDSADPGDHVRFLELSLTDGDGESCAVRVSLDVKPEDNPTLITVGTDAVTFRPIVGDLTEALANHKPTQGSVLMASAATVQDVDTTYFTSGLLEVFFSNTVSEKDRILICPPEKSQTSLQGPAVYFEDAHIGMWEHVPHPSGVSIVVTFTRFASISAVESLVRSLCFATEPAESVCRKRGPDKKEIIYTPGTIKEGIREVTLSLVVEKTEPVTATAFVKATNALLQVPVPLQSQVFVEDSEPLRLSSRFDILHEVQIFDGGILYAEFVEGFEDKDILELRLPDSCDLFLGPPKDDLIVMERMREHQAQQAAAQGNAAGQAAAQLKRRLSKSRAPRPPAVEQPKERLTGLRGAAQKVSDRGKPDIVTEMLVHVRDRVHNVRKASLRDVYLEKSSATPMSGPAMSRGNVLGTVLQDEQQVLIHFKENAERQTRGERQSTPAPAVKKKDVLVMLRGLHYQHRGDNPKELRKVIRVTLRDGTSLGSCTFHHIQVQPVNDATQIHRLSTRPVVYRQGSPEDTAGFQPFFDCTLYDPDTNNFSGGHLGVEHVTGAPGGRGFDSLSLLPAALQRRKGLRRVFEFASMTHRSEVRCDGQLIGCLLDPRDASSPSLAGLAIRFTTDHPIPIEVVEDLLRCVRYQNTSKRVKGGNVVLMLRIGASGGPDGKLKVQVRVLGPVLSVPHGTQPSVYTEGRGAVPVCPRVALNLGDRARCTDVKADVALLNARHGESLQLSFRDSPLSLKVRRQCVMEDTIVMAEITEQTPDRIAFDCGCLGSKCTGRQLQALLRCVAFDVAKGQALTLETRRVLFRVLLPEGEPFLFEVQLHVREENKATEVVMPEPEIVCCVGAQPMCLLPGCEVRDPDTPHFVPPAHVVVEVTSGSEGALDGDKLGFDLPENLPPPPKAGNQWLSAQQQQGGGRATTSGSPPKSKQNGGVTPRAENAGSPFERKQPSHVFEKKQESAMLWLSLTRGGPTVEDKATIMNRRATVATVTGRGTALMTINLSDCSLSLLQEIVQCLTYSCVTKKKQAATKRSVSIAVYTGSQKDHRPEKTVVAVELKPPPLEPNAQLNRVDVGGERAQLLPKARVNLGDFAKVSVTVEFTRPADGTPQPPQGWALGIDPKSGLQVLPADGRNGGDLVVERAKDRVREKVAEVSNSKVGLSIDFMSALSDLVTPKLVERALRALEVTVDRHAIIPPSGLAFVRVTLAERLLQHPASVGPRDASAALSFALA